MTRKSKTTVSSPKPKLLRADQLLFEKGLVPSRAKAQELIEGGHVQFKQNGRTMPLKASSKKLSEDVELEITNRELLKYVSRGGLKLEGALKYLGLAVQNLRALDIGVSTGGFSHCLLLAGAKRVVGIDVGSDETAPELKNWAQFSAIHGLNARSLSENAEVQKLKGEGFDIVTADLSFISVTHILETVKNMLRPKGVALLLIKPQFELSKKELNKQGLVKSQSSIEKVKEKILRICTELGYTGLQVFPSQLKGRDGNQEYFLFAQKSDE